MSISTSFRLFSTKFPQSLLHPKTPIFRTLISSTPLLPTNFSFLKKSISIQRIPTKPPSSSPSSSTSVSLQPIEELPPKLQEIVKLFQAVHEPKAKYEQLLFYGRNLSPLDSKFKTSENKVQGCVSQVWVRAYLDPNKNVVFEADSDSVLTKGLAALLVLGLSGRPVREIVRISPDFAVLLGLQQSLTPSRNNGFLNMLKLMQKKALQLYVEAEKGDQLSGEVENPVQSSNSGLKIDIGVGESEIGVSSEVGTNDSRSNSSAGGVGGVLGSRGERIKERLERELRPMELEVEDISYQHAGHAGVRGQDGETHFNVKVVAEEFEGKSLVKRHRLIYGLLQDELQSGLHALSIVAKTPSEVDSVAGGATSGKTTFCDMIIEQLRDQHVVLVNQDSFYHNLTAEELTRVHEYNFDHPDAFDTERLLCAMEKLKHGQAVDIPKYDFKSYKNVFPARRVNPSDVIILEGILIFHDPRVRDLMNMKIFVDTDADVRLARRIKRDTLEKGRDIGMILDQYSKFVKPAFDDFILPTKKYADIIIPRGGDNHVAIDLIVQHIRTKLGQHNLCKIYPNLYEVCIRLYGMRKQQNMTVFYADRLIRLVVEHGLGHLPFTEKQVITPTESVYTGVDFCKRLCGVSVIRSGESMENALRACCKGIKIGKILIHREGDNGQQLIYEKLPKDISDRHVLLLDPILGTGNSAVQAISLLIKKGVPESNIIFLNLISAPQGVHVVSKQFPRIKIVTSEIELGLNEDYRVIPGMCEFGDRYFGTDDDDQQVLIPTL